MNKLLFNILIFSLFFATATPADAIRRRELVTMAKSLKGLSGKDLKCAISSISQPKKVLAYGSGENNTWSGFYKTDRDETTNECINRYSLTKFYFAENYAYQALTGMNIEHSFPSSWWGGTKNNAYKDLFNLYPSESSSNQSKSNYPMGKVTSTKNWNSYELVGTGSAGTNGTISLFEPNDTWKGDFCRSYFYMATTYQELEWNKDSKQAMQILENNEWPTLQKWAYTLYLEWTRKDKVLEIEVKRNDAVYSIQGNRNLFIDFPYLAEYVWGDSINVPFDPTTSLTTASNDDRYMQATEEITPDPGDGGDTPDTDDDVEFDGFAETFSGCSGAGANDDDGWNGSIASNSLTNTSFDNEGWTYTKGNAASGCIKLGTSSEAGSAQTPQIQGLDGCTFTLYFDAAAWDYKKENTTLYLSATGCTLSTDSVQLVKGEWTTYSVTVTDVTGPIQITFAGSGSNNRFFLDNVNIPKDEVRKSVAGDLNGDGVVTIVDLTILIQRLNQGEDASADDINTITNLILNK